jgi:hypothetical protein
VLTGRRSPQGECRAGGSRVAWMSVIAAAAGVEGMIGPRAAVRRVPGRATNSSLSVSSQGQADDLIDEGFVVDAHPLGGFGDFLAVGDIGIGIGLEDDELVVGREAEVDSAVVPHL